MKRTRGVSNGLVVACCAITIFAAGTAAAQLDCGNAFYDDGYPADAGWFDGSKAGDPDYMFAVFFELDDFGYEPGRVEITGFCAGNVTDFGDIWANQVYIYPDNNGVPDENQVLGMGTILTGNGLGHWTVMLDGPVILHSDFWLVNRGYPPFLGTDFNMDGDVSPDSGHSYFSDNGINNLMLVPQDGGGDWCLRAYLQPVSRSYLTAGMAHAGGANDSQWRSKFAVLNPSDAAAGVEATGLPANVTLRYLHGSDLETETITLAAGEMRAWDDVAADLFGVSADSAGSIQVVSNSPVVVTARTYNIGDVGTFGQFLPGVQLGESMTSGQTGILSQLSNTDRFRTNVGFTNLGEQQVQVRVTLYDASGGLLGTKNMTIAAGAWKQQNNIFGAVGAGMMDNAYAKVEVLTDGGTVWGYASVVDDPPGDPTTIPLVIQ